MINKQEIIRKIAYIEEIETILTTKDSSFYGFTNKQMACFLFDYPIDNFNWDRGSGKTFTTIIKNLLKLDLPIKLKYDECENVFKDINGNIIDFSEGDIDCKTQISKRYLNNKAKDIFNKISARSYLVHCIEK